MNIGKARKFVYKRSTDEDGYRVCEIRLFGICVGRATDWHHRKNRSQGGLWTPSNGLDLCHACHMTITDTRSEYYDMGWLVKRDRDPALVPVTIFSFKYPYGERVSVLLDDEGDCELALFPPVDSRDPDDIPWSPPTAPDSGAAA